jgi:hypothetical protein
LAAIRSSDVDLNSNSIHLTDERISQRRQQLGNVRRTTRHCSRALPIHPQLRKVVEQLKTHPMADCSMALCRSSNSLICPTNHWEEVRSFLSGESGIL